MISRRALLAGASGLIASPALAFPVIDSAPPRRLDSILARMGLWDNCTLCLDAGDPRSYLGGQVWTDIAAGRNFNRGTDASVGVDDPEFVGTPGNLSQADRWLLDGDAWFSKVSANDATIESWHKNSAVLSLVSVFADGGTGGAIFSTRPSQSVTTQSGIILNYTATNELRYSVANGGGVALSLDYTTTMQIPSSGPAMVGLAVNEPAGTGLFWCSNGEQEPFTSTYVSPGSGNATGKLSFCARSSGGSPMTTGSDIYHGLAFDTALTADQFAQMWELIRKRPI